LSFCHHNHKTKHMITHQEIEDAKQRTKYGHPAHEVLHEHDDCIRLAYAWLDAQKKTKKINYRKSANKHEIEKWAGRYISQSDVEVAAELHADVVGIYPHFNISSRRDFSIVNS
jgi:hypothetical protein